MSSTLTAHRRLAAWLSSVVLLDAAIAAAAFAGSLLLLQHGGAGPSGSGSEKLELAGVVLVACSTVPLVAWRRFPLGVFVVTAAASVLLVGLGYWIDLLLGSAVALYLLAASRDPQAPWTWRITVIVVGLLVAYLGAAAAARGALSEAAARAGPRTQ
jgi:hypothetical protein